MDLTNIQLPDFVIASLFSNTLVLIDNEVSLDKSDTKTKSITPKETIPVEVLPIKKLFLGNNEKQITIVVNDNSAVFLADDGLAFLSNVLAACKLNISHVAIINLFQTPLTYTEIKQQLQPKFLLLFDIHPNSIQMPFTMPLYQVQQYDGCQMVIAANLQNMLGEGDTIKQEKMKLWTSLKKMFL